MPASSRAVVAQQRVLGIDPGLTRCGLACVDIDPRRRARLVEVGGESRVHDVFVAMVTHRA